MKQYVINSNVYIYILHYNAHNRLQGLLQGLFEMSYNKY